MNDFQKNMRALDETLIGKGASQEQRNELLALLLLSAITTRMKDDTKFGEFVAALAKMSDTILKESYTVVSDRLAKEAFIDHILDME